MKASIYNIKNEAVGEIDLPDEVFAVQWNPDLVHQVVTAQLANRRRPWAHTKSRGEVRGGGKKPWRQKGTGRARHGSIRSPLWRGGGVTFGPRKERDYSQKINRKMLRRALHSVLSKKLAENEIKIYESLMVIAGKTRELKWLPQSTLLVPGKLGKLTFRAAANLPQAAVLAPDSLNVYDLLKHKNIFIEKEAVAAIR